MYEMLDGQPPFKEQHEVNRVTDIGFRHNVGRQLWVPDLNKHLFTEQAQIFLKKTFRSVMINCEPLIKGIIISHNTCSNYIITNKYQRL